MSERIECEERHYARFLRKVLPGPERALGAFVCDECGMYFDEDGVIVPPEKLDAIRKPNREATQ